MTQYETKGLGSTKNMNCANMMTGTRSYKKVMMNASYIMVEAKVRGKVVGSITATMSNGNFTHMSTASTGNQMKPVDVNECLSIARRAFKIA